MFSRAWSFNSSEEYWSSELVRVGRNSIQKCTWMITIPTWHVIPFISNSYSMISLCPRSFYGPNKQHGPDIISLALNTVGTWVRWKTRLWKTKSEGGRSELFYLDLLLYNLICMLYKLISLNNPMIYIIWSRFELFIGIVPAIYYQ